MREIKFRAWDKKEKRMFCEFDSSTQKEWFIPNLNGEGYVFLQYTGKDKNETEI